MTVSLTRRLSERLIPAALTPMSADRVIDQGQLEAYAAGLTGHDLGGVAVWAHTGRGPHLSGRQRATVLRTFRRATDLPLLAGVGPGQALTTAEAALDGGADGLLVFPPTGAADAGAVLRHHECLATEFDAPMVLFLLYAEAGGVAYEAPLLRELMAIPQVAGLKLATLDSAMTCQDTIWLLRSEFPDKLVITGEDRMFGPSLTWGAQAALVGLAASAVQVSERLVGRWFSGDAAGFLTASRQVDQLAAVTFRAPMEGYVQRMLWIAAHEGLITEDVAFDPYGPTPNPAERTEVINTYNQLTDQTENK